MNIRYSFVMKYDPVEVMRRKEEEQRHLRVYERERLFVRKRRSKVDTKNNDVMTRR
jgi:hypothetical protein